MGGNQAFLPQVKCWSIYYDYSFPVDLHKFCFFGFHFILKFRYQIFSCLCLVTRDFDHYKPRKIYMTSTVGSETHKVRGDGEIVYTLFHHSTSILHFYRDVKFKPDKKWIWGGLPEWRWTKYFGNWPLERSSGVKHNKARGLQHETEKSKWNSN
jgi:hypothetical protein